MRLFASWPKQSRCTAPGSLLRAIALDGMEPEPEQPAAALAMEEQREALAAAGVSERCGRGAGPTGAGGRHIEILELFWGFLDPDDTGWVNPEALKAAYRRSGVPAGRMLAADAGRGR